MIMEDNEDIKKIDRSIQGQADTKKRQTKTPRQIKKMFKKEGLKTEKSDKPIRRSSVIVARIKLNRHKHI